MLLSRGTLLSLALLAVPLFLLLLLLLLLSPLLDLLTQQLLPASQPTWRPLLLRLCCPCRASAVC
jgi:hypothetical protein